MSASEDRREPGNIFQRFFDMSLDMLCIAGLDGFFKKVNAAMITTLGWTEEELLSRPWIEFVHPEDRQSTEAARGKLVDGGKVSYFENRYQGKDGSYHWLSWNSMPAPEQELIFAVAREITAQKQMEEELQRYRTDLEKQVQERTLVMDRINMIFRVALFCETEEQLGNACLAAAEKLTGSEFGLICEQSPAGSCDPIAISFPAGAACDLPAAEALHPLQSQEIRGLCDWVLEKGESLIYNDPASHPEGLESPGSHPVVTSFLGVPLKLGPQTCGMIGLANREGGYNKRNQADAEALAEAVVEILMRKRAEWKLEQLRQYHELILSSASEGIFGLDLNGNITFANPAAAQMLGYKEEELIGRNAHAVVHHSKPDGTPYPLEDCPLMETLRRGARLSFQDEFFFKKDGAGFPARCSRNPIMQGGQISGAVVTFRDITERKQAEEALRQSEEKFRRTFDQSPIGAAMIGLDFHYLRVNDQLCRITGYTQEELADRTFMDITYADDLAINLELTERLAAGKIDHFTMEKRYLRKDGSTVWVRVSVRLIKDAAGKPLYFLPMIEDIDAYKQAEENLQLTLSQLKQVIGEIVRAMSRTVEVRDPYTAGHQRRVTRLAQAIAREMGLSQAQKKGVWVAGTLHDLGKVYVPAGILSRPGRLTDVEFALVKTHSEKGYEILQPIKFPWPVAQIVRQHHERLNGSGYPDGLQGDEILLEARILAVADVVEAMASHRPYRPALGVGDALEEISRNRGVLYDPEVVDACLKVFTEKGFKFE